jgi:hypothetical protein
LLIAVARGDVPEGYIDLALDENAVVPVPTAPSHLMYIADCLYTRKICRIGEIKQPRGDGDGVVCFGTYRKAQTSAWRAQLHAHIAAIESGDNLTTLLCSGPADSPGSQATTEQHQSIPTATWLHATLEAAVSKTSAVAMLRELHFHQSLAQDGVRARRHGGGKLASQPVPPLFRQLLRQLRKAEESGKWPASSISRRNVIDDRSKLGESFAMGRMPPHLVQPKANALFPELYAAAVALEHSCCPARSASSSIVVPLAANTSAHLMLVLPCLTLIVIVHV